MEESSETRRHGLQHQHQQARHAADSDAVTAEQQRKRRQRRAVTASTNAIHQTLHEEEVLLMDLNSAAVKEEGHQNKPKHNVKEGGHQNKPKHNVKEGGHQNKPKHNVKEEGHQNKPKHNVKEGGHQDTPKHKKQQQQQQQRSSSRTTAARTRAATKQKQLQQNRRSAQATSQPQPQRRDTGMHGTFATTDDTPATATAAAAAAAASGNDDLDSELGFHSEILGTPAPTISPTKKTTTRPSRHKQKSNASGSSSKGSSRTPMSMPMPKKRETRSAAGRTTGTATSTTSHRNNQQERKQRSSLSPHKPPRHATSMDVSAAAAPPLQDSRTPPNVAWGAVKPGATNTHVRMTLVERQAAAAQKLKARSIDPSVYATAAPAAKYNNRSSRKGTRRQQEQRTNNTPPQVSEQQTPARTSPSPQTDVRITASAAAPSGCVEVAASAAAPSSSSAAPFRRDDWRDMWRQERLRADRLEDELRDLKKKFGVPASDERKRMSDDDDALRAVRDVERRVDLQALIPGLPSDCPYPPIEAHGIIGNMHTCALVSLRASIDWYCFPSFDSPSLFAAVLDNEKGGQFSITPVVNNPAKFRQFYHDGTNVLITHFSTATGTAHLHDFFVVSKNTPDVGHGWILRELEVRSGEVTFDVDCVPRFNYGRDDHIVDIVTHGARFRSDALKMVLTSCSRRPWKKSQRWHGGASVRLTLKQGEREVFIFRESQADAIDTGKIDNPYANESHPDHSGHPVSVKATKQLRHRTMAYWRTWLAQCSYVGRWRERVYRSALVLKLLTFEPSGAIIAAPTTSLPEQMGGTRNWDYRFSWIRDSCFVVYAFLRLGFREEAAAFMKWIEARCEECPTAAAGAVLRRDTPPLQIMYGIRGEKHLPEIELPKDHFEGYCQSQPVRIGNGAANQLQLDIYGELLDTVYLSDAHAEHISYKFWKHLITIVDWVAKFWDQPDEGIWEVRGGRQHFVYSKIMIWTCMDRTIRLARSRSLPCPNLTEYIAVRDQVYEQIQERGWNEEVQAYTQFYGSRTLDASCLVIPWVYFSAPTDPRFVSTIDAILKSPAENGLTMGNLVYRYNARDVADGFGGEDEGTFTICTFWAVEACARLGDRHPKYLHRARDIFEETLGYANHLGLYSEEIGNMGEALGNFPQAFTHLAFISAAFNLDRALNRRTARFQAATGVAQPSTSMFQTHAKW